MYVSNGERSSVRVIDVAVVATSSFPQIRGCPFLLSCSLGRSLFHRLEDIRHIISLFVGMDEYVNVIGHEHVCEDGEVKFCRSCIDSIDKEFADSIVEQVLPAVVS